MVTQNRIEPPKGVNAARRLARDLDVSEEIAVEAYEREWNRLHEGARVKHFVSVLAEKHARLALKSDNHS